jgi:hypothetical protein
MGFFDLFKGKDTKTVSNETEQPADEDIELEEGFLTNLLNEDSESDDRHKRMYAFTHIALRDATFENHPELVEELSNFRTNPSPLPLVHFWSRAEMIVGDMDDEIDEDGWTPFAEISIDAYNKNGYTVYIITLPKPQLTPEAYFVAIAVDEDATLEYMNDMGETRYFTLEHTADGYEPMFCEWDRDDDHLNYGEVPHKNKEGFAELVFEHL